MPFCDNRAAVKIDGKWGYIDQKGETQIAPKYTEAGGFESGLARVCVSEILGMGGTCSWIDPSGKTVWTPTAQQPQSDLKEEKRPD
jgi:hypothetical protein